MTEVLAGNVTRLLTVQERALLDKKAQLQTLIRYVAKTYAGTDVRLDFDLPDRCRYEVRMSDQTSHGLGCGLAFDTQRAVFFDDYGSYDTESLKCFTEHVFACAQHGRD